MSRNLAHRALSVRSKVLDKIGKAALRFYLYRENNYFHPDYNGEHRILARLKAAGVEPKTIFDIGANEGRWSEHVSRMWPDARIHMFEPMPAIANRLVGRFCDDDRFRVHAVAVGGQDGVVTLHENTEVTSHSFVSRDVGDGEGVKLVSGATALKQASTDHVDLLKIDAEGFDLEILHGLQTQLELRQISFIQFEHHALAVSYQRPFAETSAYLQGLGYRVGKIFPEGLREIRYGSHDWSNQIGPNFFAAAPDQSAIFEKLLSR